MIEDRGSNQRWQNEQRYQRSPQKMIFIHLVRSVRERFLGIFTDHVGANSR